MHRLAIALSIIQLGFSQSTLVKTTRLLDVENGRYLIDQGILIENGYIKQIGPYESVRAAVAGVATIDLSGTTVVPGLIDCHTHMLDAMPEAMNGADALILTIAKTSPVKRAFLGARMAKQYLDSGFTIVRNVGHSGIDGDAVLRDVINSGWIPGPRILASARKIAPLGGQALPVQDAVLDAILRQDFLTASNPDEGRRAVLDNLRVNVDILKVVVDEGARTINLDTMKAIVEEAHKVGIKVAAHATSEMAIQEAIDSGVDSVEHGDSGTEQQFRAMRDKGIYLVPTLWPRELTQTWPDLVGVDIPERLKHMDREMYLKQNEADQQSKMQRARQAGVKIAFGSDEWVERRGRTRGEAVLLLLAAYQHFGMSPVEALRAATIQAANLLGVGQFAGSIQVKKFGDLVAVDGDPLQNLSDITRVGFVMKGGRVVRDDRNASCGRN